MLKFSKTNLKIERALIYVNVKYSSKQIYDLIKFGFETALDFF